MLEGIRVSSHVSFTLKPLTSKVAELELETDTALFCTYCGIRPRSVGSLMMAVVVLENPSVIARVNPEVASC
jgi:hypothetical protein